MPARGAEWGWTGGGGGGLGGAGRGKRRPPDEGNPVWEGVGAPTAGRERERRRLRETDGGPPQVLFRGFGLFAGSVILMRNFGDLMAV